VPGRHAETDDRVGRASIRAGNVQRWPDCRCGNRVRGCGAGKVDGAKHRSIQGDNRQSGRRPWQVVRRHRRACPEQVSPWCRQVTSGRRRTTHARYHLEPMGLATYKEGGDGVPLNRRKADGSCCEALQETVRLVLPRPVTDSGAGHGTAHWCLIPSGPARANAYRQGSAQQRAGVTSRASYQRSLQPCR
jgi:hypothetical protein